jgi:hypothetical protein
MFLFVFRGVLVSRVSISCLGCYWWWAQVVAPIAPLHTPTHAHTHTHTLTHTRSQYAHTRTLTPKHTQHTHTTHTHTHTHIHTHAHTHTTGDTLKRLIEKGDDKKAANMIKEFKIPDTRVCWTKVSPAVGASVITLTYTHAHSHTFTHTHTHSRERTVPC